METYQLYLLYVLPFTFAFAANGMAREMMFGAFRYRKRKSELKNIEKIIRSPLAVIICPYSLFKPTFAPKHMMFCWVLRIINIVIESIMITLIIFDFYYLVFKIIHCILGCINMIFTIYTATALRGKHKKTDLNKSIFIRWDNLM